MFFTIHTLERVYYSWAVGCKDTIFSGVLQTLPTEMWVGKVKNANQNIAQSLVSSVHFLLLPNV